MKQCKHEKLACQVCVDVQVSYPSRLPDLMPVNFAQISEVSLLAALNVSGRQTSNHPTTSASPPSCGQETVQHKLVTNWLPADR